MDRELVARELVLAAKDLTAKDGYIMKMDYDLYDEDAGDWYYGDDFHGSKKFSDLRGLLREAEKMIKERKTKWEKWNRKQGAGWISSGKGERLYQWGDAWFGLLIERADGKPLSRDDVKYISRELRIK